MCSRLNHRDVTVRYIILRTHSGILAIETCFRLDGQRNHTLHQRRTCGEVGIDFVYDISLQEHAISNTTLMIDAGIAYAPHACAVCILPDNINIVNSRGFPPWATTHPGVRRRDDAMFVGIRCTVCGCGGDDVLVTPMY